MADDRETVKVFFHSTCVFEFDRSSHIITLRNGGWFTVTTKNRINQAMDELNLGCRLVQEKKRWYVDITHPIGSLGSSGIDTRIPFTEGMTFSAAFAEDVGPIPVRMSHFINEDNTYVFQERPWHR